ncbi:MAG: InlB B-repeat-containing protein [Solirubrobacterales bacterium]
MNPSTGGFLACWANYTGTRPVEIKCDALSADGIPAGAPQTITSTPDEYTMTNLAWSTAKGKFLVTMTDWTDYARVSFVDPSGAPFGSVVDFMPDSAYDMTGGAGVAYSPTSNRFMVYARGRTVGSSEGDAPWLWLLDGDGNVVGSPQRIDPDTSLDYKNASIVWNASRDEFVIMSINNKTAPEFYIRRFKATDGSPVGDAKTATAPSTDFDYRERFRPQLAANAFSDQMLAYVVLNSDPTGAARPRLYGVHAMEVSGDGTMGALQPVAGGTSSFYTQPRPWLTFNPYSCEYLGDFNAVDTAATNRLQLYTSRYTQPQPCKADLTVAKSGKGSGTVSGTATESQMGLGSKPVSEGTTTLYRSYKVSLTASAQSGSKFSGWSGACSGKGTCEVSMREARSVTATFTADKPKLKLSVRAPEKVKAGRAFRVTIKTSNVAKSGAARASSTRAATTARNVKTCARLAKGLYVVKSVGGEVKGKTICWTRSSLAAGKSVSFRPTVRSSKTKAGSMKVGGTASASNGSGATVKASGSSRVRIVEPKEPKPKPPTG